MRLEASVEWKLCVYAVVGASACFLSAPLCMFTAHDALHKRGGASTKQYTAAGIKNRTSFGHTPE